MDLSQTQSTKPVGVLPAAIIVLMCLFPALTNAQGLWTDIAEISIRSADARQIIPLKYRTISADISALQQILDQAPDEQVGTPAALSGTILVLPMPDGSMARFAISESPIMASELAERYPDIRTFLGQGIDDPHATLRCDLTPSGFHAMIMSPTGSVFIDPYQKGDIQHYISYFKRDFVPSSDKIMIEHSDVETDKLQEETLIRSAVPSGSQLRTYRLALAVDANYYTFQGGTDASVMAAVVTSINRVNQVYEAEVAIRMVLIANTDDLFFDASVMPYPYTASGACDLRPENQAAIDAVVGNDAYDIGHLFAMSAGGCAAFNSVCNNGSKAWGVTGTGNPVGDPFDIDYVCHEIGHQFNGAHTWNGTLGSCSADQYSGSSAYEPGSGSTIMAYAGICDGDNLQPNSDPYFHTHSFDQIVAYSTTGTGNSCPVVGNTGNNAPSVNAGANYTIPKSTPFKLTGSASDPDGDALTYCWEEFDLGPAGPPNVSTTTGPIFRSFNPTTGTSRTFPRLSDILNNTSTIGEILPGIGRTMTFRLTARDNRAGGGGVNYDNMTLTIDGDIGPFSITSFNSTTTLCPGPQTVTWNVNGADALAANVNILLSYDGGNTFPETLAANTPNDGSQEVTIPCTYSATARFKVEAAGNVFFDISNANVTVGDNTPPTFTDPADITIFKDSSCDFNASVAITGDVTNENDNCSTGLNATFSDALAAGSCDGETIITRTWTLEDNCRNTTTKVQIITVQDKIAPTFTVPDDATIFKDENCDFDASVGETGDVTDEMDNCDMTLDAVFTDVVVAGACIGEELITRTWTLTDDCGNSSSGVQSIVAQDITGPVIANVYPDPAILWPPNHKMIDVVINYTAVDNCSPVINGLTVTSNEPVEGTGDGNTFPDWVVIDDHHVALRAERSGNGSGRIYTITITSTDDCGNSSTATTQVLVPHEAPPPPALATPYSSDLAVDVQPNPTTEGFNITVNSNDINQVLIVAIYDTYGRIVDERSVYSGSSFSIGEKFPQGHYILSLTQSDGGSITRQLIKIR